MSAAKLPRAVALILRKLGEVETFDDLALISTALGDRRTELRAAALRERLRVFEDAGRGSVWRLAETNAIDLARPGCPLVTSPSRIAWLVSVVGARRAAKRPGAWFSARALVNGRWSRTDLLFVEERDLRGALRVEVSK